MPAIDEPRNPSTAEKTLPTASDAAPAPADAPIEEWELAALQDHPLQSTYFPDASEPADAELAADMAENGQQLAIDILPDGTILCGHRRVRAARRLGWTKIDVIVRDDLADDPEAAEAYFIGDNYTRRQLTELQKVRCAKRRVELARRGKVALPAECRQRKKTRDQIGWLMGKSGRHAERYLKLLEAPVELQHACDAGHLSLVEAAKIAGFSQQKQQQIVQQLREQGLENAKAIYDRHRPAKAATPRGAMGVWCNLQLPLQEALRELPGNTHKLHGLDENDLAFIQEAKGLFAELEVRTAQSIEQRIEDEPWQDTDDLVHDDEIAAVERGVDTVSTPPETPPETRPVDTMSSGMAT